MLKNIAAYLVDHVAPAAAGEPTTKCPCCGAPAEPITMAAYGLGRSEAGDWYYAPPATAGESDEVRQIRDILSHIADAIGLAPYYGAYRVEDVLPRLRERLAAPSAEREGLADKEIDRAVGDLITMASDYISPRWTDLERREIAAIFGARLERFAAALRALPGEGKP